MNTASLGSLLNCEAWSVPGCQLIVRKQGQLLHEEHKGFADVLAQEPMTAQHHIPMGSLMHSMVSAMIVRLMRVSTLSIDASLSQIAKHYRQDGGRLASIVSSYPQLRSLTLLDLLQHTSGLPSYDQTDVFLSALMRNPKKSWQLEAYLDMIVGYDVDYCYGYQPVKKGVYSYSTTNFLIASLVISAITGHDMLDELQFFVDRHFPGEAILASTRDTHVIDTLPMVHGYVHPSCPYRQLFERCPLVTYGDNSECRAYDITKARNLNACAGLVGFTTLVDITQWMSSIWLADRFGPASQAFFPSSVLASELTTEGNPVYSGLGMMQTMCPEFGSLYWMQGFSYGYEVLILHAVQSSITMGLMLNVSREQVGLQKGGLVHQLLTQLHR